MQTFFDKASAAWSDRDRRFWIVIGFAALVWAFYAFAEFGRMFLLIEYRSWAARGSLFNPLLMLDPHGMVRSRLLSYFTAALATEICGYRPACHDAYQIALILAAGVLLALALRRLFPDSPLGLVVAAMLFPLTTSAALESLAWQATLLDKLALFFTALGIFAVSAIDLARLDRRRVLITNGLLLLVVFCAYNSKEAAFPLAPSMFGLLVLRFLALVPAVTWNALREASRRTATLLAAPLAYGLIHVALVYQDRMFLNPREAARVMGGTWWVNLKIELLYLFSATPLAQALGKYPYMPIPDIIAFLVDVLVFVVAVALFVARFGSTQMRLTWLWAALSFLMAIAIPLRTTAPSAFYLLVPSFYLAIWLFVTALVVVRAFPSPAAVRGTVVAVALLTAAHVLGFLESAPPYLAMATMSDNFTRALPEVGTAYTASGKPAHVVFLWPETAKSAYMFMAVPSMRRLAVYTLPPGASTGDDAAFDSAVTDGPYPPAAARPTPQRDTLTVVFGEDLRLLAIVPPAK